MGVLPIVSTFIEFVVLHGSADALFLIARWLVFWSVGVRPPLAGLRRITNLSFTAQTIFAVKDRAAPPIVQELGFGKLSIGLLGALALLVNDWIVPAALVGGPFYGLAGIQHQLISDRNAAETVAMVLDLFIFLVLAGDLAAVMLNRGRTVRPPARFAPLHARVPLALSKPRRTTGGGRECVLYVELMSRRAFLRHAHVFLQPVGFR